MKIYLHIPLLALLAATALGGEAINEEAPMGNNGRLEVSNVAGAVEIYGWTRQRISVTGELGDQSELIFDVNGDVARVKIEFEGKKRNRESTDLIIRVPHSTRVSATTVSADLTVDDIQGVQRLQTVSGDLQTRTFAAEVEAKTVSGELDIRGNGARAVLVASTVSGDIDAVEVGGELSFATVSGDVEIAAGDFSRLRMRSVSGDLELAGNLDKGGRIDAESVSGSVRLDLGDLYDTEYRLESFSGNIESILGYAAKRKSKYGPGSYLELTEGDGSSSIRVETMSGDIDISSIKRMKKKPAVRQSTGKPERDTQEDVDFDRAMEDLARRMEKLGGKIDRSVDRGISVDPDDEFAIVVDQDTE